MFGVSLILLLAIMGGVIAFLGDKLGSKIGKKRLSVLGLRPHYTSILMTVISGICIAAVTMGILTGASQEARTALFGMNKLKAELTSLAADKTKMEAELQEQTAKVADLHQKIDLANTEKNLAQAKLTDVQSNYQEAQARLDSAEGQVQSLQASKNNLKTEIGQLEEATAKLREGLTAIREGDVVFRSGEVLYSGVLKAGLPAAQNKGQMDEFLALANGRILDRLQAKEDLQALWLPQDMVEEALKVIGSAKGSIYVRVCAAGNIISGELAVSRLELVLNKLIFTDGQKLLTQQISVDIATTQPEQALLAFLKEVNKVSVGAGIIPDPITGKVGQIEAKEMEAVSQKIRTLGGKVKLTAYARQDIYVSGPVLLKVEVETL